MMAYNAKDYQEVLKTIIKKLSDEIILVVTEIEEKNIGKTQESIKENTNSEDNVSESLSSLENSIDILIKDTNYKATLQYLNKEVISICNQDEEFSFIHYLIENLQADAEDYQRLKDDEFYLDGYVRSKVKSFLEGIERRLGLEDAKEYDTLYGRLNTISDMAYEGNSVNGKMLIIKKELKIDDSEYLVKFQEKISIRNHRLMRKLIEVSSKELILVCDNDDARGFISIDTLKNNAEKYNNNIVIYFTGHGSYKVNILKEEENNILTIRQGVPILQQSNYSPETFKKTLEKIFKDISKDEIDYFQGVIEQAVQQTHGTMLVITKEAEREIKNFKNQGILTNKEKLDKEIIKNITEIDGAVLLDNNGYCHGIGVILDGLATEKVGDLSRGARYNSALKYMEKEGIKGNTVIVIISEDGMINILPADEKDIAEILLEITQFIKDHQDRKDIDFKEQLDELMELEKISATHQDIIALLIGNINYYIKNYMAAKKYYKKVLAINPNHSNAHNNLGNLLRNNYFKDFKTAKKHYIKAIELNPINVYAYNNLALLLSNYFNDYKEAKKHYLKALDINPNYADAYNNLGTLLQEQFNDYESAKAYYVKAIELNPKYANPHNNLAFLLSDYLKEFKKAKIHYNKAIKLNPNCVEAHFNLAFLLKDHFNEYELGKHHYLKALELNPDIVNHKDFKKY